MGRASMTTEWICGQWAASLASCSTTLLSFRCTMNEKIRERMCVRKRERERMCVCPRKKKSASEGMSRAACRILQYCCPHTHPDIHGLTHFFSLSLSLLPLQGENDIDQLFCVLRVMGTPSPQRWPVRSRSCICSFFFPTLVIVTK